MSRPVLTTVKAWLPAVVMCVVIFLFSQDGHSGRHSDEVLRWILGLLDLNTRHYRLLFDGPFRKLAHVVVYFLLGASAYRGFALGRKHFDVAAAVRGVVFCAVYAATDEYHQSLIPGRGPSGRDVLLDTAAAVAAMLVIWVWLRPRHRPATVLASAAHRQ